MDKLGWWTDLEQGDVGHDASDDIDHFGIIVEQIPPILSSHHTNHTTSSAHVLLSLTGMATTTTELTHSRPKRRYS